MPCCSAKSSRLPSVPCQVRLRPARVKRTAAVAPAAATGACATPSRTDAGPNRRDADPAGDQDYGCRRVRVQMGVAGRCAHPNQIAFLHPVMEMVGRHTRWPGWLLRWRPDAIDRHSALLAGRSAARRCDAAAMPSRCRRTAAAQWPPGSTREVGRRMPGSSPWCLSVAGGRQARLDCGQGPSEAGPPRRGPGPAWRAGTPAACPRHTAARPARVPVRASRTRRPGRPAPRS